MRRRVESVLWLTTPISIMLAAVTSAKIPLMVLGALCVGATLVVVPLHFFRAWRRLGSVPNRREYAVWVGLETLFVAGLAAGFVSCVVSR
jgi:apolipoprotein N-acyltransferase